MDLLSQEEGKALAQRFEAGLVQAGLMGFQRFLDEVSPQLRIDLPANYQSMLVTYLISDAIENVFEADRAVKLIPDGCSRIFQFSVGKGGFNLRVAKVNSNYESNDNNGSLRLEQYKAQQLCLPGMEPLPNLELGWQSSLTKRSITSLAVILPHTSGIHWYFELPLVDTSNVVTLAPREERPIPEVGIRIKESVQIQRHDRRANDGGASAKRQR